MFCKAGNKYIPERKAQGLNFLFQQRTFLFRDWTVQIKEKKSPLEEKEEAEAFSTQGYTCFMPYRYIFSTSQTS